MRNSDTVTTVDMYALNLRTGIRIFVAVIALSLLLFFVLAMRAL